MATARYKDLCIDANDPLAQARFWGPLLGWRAVGGADGDASLRGERDGREVVHVWVNRVAEPVAAKNRIHVDVHAHTIEPIVAAGASVVDADTFGWTVMRDPDGQLFCVFLREPSHPVGIYELGWDVTGGPEEAHALAQWWANVLGASLHREDDYSWIGPVPGAPFEAICFAPVPEPKSGKNRMHIDVHVADLAPLMRSGASLLRPKGDGGIGWHVMADPAGNEFCAFTRD